MHIYIYIRLSQFVEALKRPRPQPYAVTLPRRVVKCEVRRIILVLNP